MVCVRQCKICAQRRRNPSAVGRYTKMDVFGLHDELFCGLAHVDSCKLNRSVFRARLVEFAAKCIDISEALDIQIQESGNEE